LKCTKWDSVTNNNTIAAFDKFNDILEEAMLICYPVIKKQIKSTPVEPWFTRSMLKNEKLKRNYCPKLGKKVPLNVG
jgi:hypothetical protein